ncbi:MAG: hypothetical protein O3A96_07955 [Proteobacteria bacterium]|nr:hypothetical protein [Pseudomonadota bacterium]
MNLIERRSSPRGAATQCRAASTAARRCHVARRPRHSDSGFDRDGGRAGLLIAPLVAYDRAGFRPGEGAGYSGLTIAGQEDDAVPREAHDRRLDRIVMEDAAIGICAQGGVTAGKDVA